MRTRFGQRRGGRVMITLLTGLLVGGIVGAGVVYLFGGHRNGKGHVSEPTLVKADEMALVPADASAFIHVRVSETWKTEALAGLRGLVKSAGSDAVSSLDESFLPSPSTLERATIVLVRPESPKLPQTKAELPPAFNPKKGGIPMPKPVEKPKIEPVEDVIILVFSSPFDENALKQGRMMPNAMKETVNGKEYYVSPRHDGKWENRNGKMIEIEQYRSERAVYIVNSTTLVTGTKKAMDLFLSRSGNTSGPLSGAIKQAAEGNRHFVAAMNIQEEGMLDFLREHLPAEAGPFVGPIFRASCVSASLIVGDPAKLEFRPFFRDEKSAEESMSSLRDGAQAGWSGKGKPTMLVNGVKGRGGAPGPHFISDAMDVVPALSAIATLNIMQKMIQDSEVKIDGKEIAASIVYPTAGEAVVQMFLMATGMTLPAIQARHRQDRETALTPLPVGKIDGPPMKGPGPGLPGPGLPGPGPGNIAPMPTGPKIETKNKPIPKGNPPKISEPMTVDDAARFKSQNNLKQIALSMHFWEDTNQRFPAAAIIDGNKKPLLSWRVALLPLLGEKSLYDEFKLDQPWDSEHNKKLIARMPDVFANPRLPAAEGKTNYKVFLGPATGPSSVFRSNFTGTRISDFTDGTSNTILIVEGGDTVEWTKPEDIAFDPKSKTPDLTVGGKDDICVAMADGSTKIVKWNSLKEETRKALITTNGDEILPRDWDK